jgi:hypothetical protein
MLVTDPEQEKRMLSARGFRKLVPLLAASVLGTAASLGAQTVTVGTAEPGGNCIPFSCANSFVVSRYQQVFAAAAFAGTGGPMDIVALTFFSNLDPTNTFGDATYSIFLSTTDAAVNGLSANLADNVGADEAAFATATISGTVAGPTLTFNGSAFRYDPMDGNLLMDIFITAVGEDGDAFFAYDATSSESSRAYEQGGLGTTDTKSLVTEFTYEKAPVTATPEPATAPLLATGIIGLAGWRRRRARTRLAA